MTAVEFDILNQRLGRIESLIATRRDDLIPLDHLVTLSGFKRRSLMNLASQGWIRKVGNLYSYRSWIEYNEKCERDGRKRGRKRQQSGR